MLKKIIANLVILLPVMVFPIFVFAKLVPCNGPDCTVCHLFLGVKNIINFLSYNIAMPLAVLALIYGGVMILTSGGSETRRDKGKKAISAAIWGLIIVFASWLIIDTILGNLVKPGYLPWNVFPGC
ncbi:pilin [Patescibacteria group bacterium]|nr:pilin [Patescibacteria group bacterium]MBU4353177.1 pilin [Patescibacteria group bacterium]MBU4477370.1 pilin [Patescibacteria group bacterium]MCG2699260.1 pilin [Candidatus Parcubacteria bacterium]